MRFILIIATTDQELTNGILDLVTGRAQAQLAAVAAQTEQVLHQAEAINLDPPKPAV